MNKPKLLLADDSVTIRKVVELTFADEGIEVSTVADAAMAMQRFVEIQPDIVLVDVGLDGTSGYQICEMIKADEATRHIPVLLLVGSFEPFDQAEAERVDADGFLTKPFHSIRDLVARVWDLLGREAAPATEVRKEADTLDLPPIPTFGDAFTEDIPVTDEPEFDDIGDLYRSSFAETMKIEDLDTVEVLLGDSGMDDEMIETNQVSPHPEHSFADLSVTNVSDAEVKEFDWSPQSLVTTSDTEVSPLAENESEVLEPPHEDAVPSSPSEGEGTTMETLEVSDASDLVERVDEAEGESDNEAELFDVLDFRITPSDTPKVESDLEVQKDDDVDPAIHDTIPYAPGDQPPVAEDTVSIPENVDVEMIERIAQRVIERLSDSVVREIAKVEVPRIAEKLIREALEHEGKG